MTALGATTEAKPTPIGPWTLGAKITESIIQHVCELPDYTSPDDQPNLLQCTVEELDEIISNTLEQHVVAITSACNSFDALTEANKKLREALEKILPLYQSFVHDAGGCDHSVGICMCADFEALRLAGAALKVTP